MSIGGLAELASAMSKAVQTVVLTGAGMSTESGLPDYRGPEGLWKNKRFEELASIEQFQRDPIGFWECYRMRLQALRSAAPNPAHLALAQMQIAGTVSALVTQNVDGLHSAAGSEALEVHGSLRRAECLQCARNVDMDEVERRYTANNDGLPLCDCGSVLKPAVVLFGEMLPPAIEDAFAAVESCDVLLVCGTSLSVYPVASLAQVVLARGAVLAIINRGTTEYDHLADIHIDAPLGEALPALLSLLER